MEARSARATGSRFWRIGALLPVVLLAVVVGGFVTTGSALTDLLGRNPPPADEFNIRRVEFKHDEIRIRVTNPQRDELTIASVTVDDAIVPFSVDGDRQLRRLRSATIVVPYAWVEDEPISVGVTSSTGIETTKEIAAAVETPGLSFDSFLGYGVIGLLVGVVPVALGLLWLPSLRRTNERWLSAFLALTGGLLTFLGIEALAEAFERQSALPEPLAGAGLVLLGVAASYLTMTFLGARLSRRGGTAAAGAAALALLVAIGIGVHNFGEGLAIGTSFAFGELTLGTFLIVGFMIHNITEGLGIAAPAAESRSRLGLRRLGTLALIAGGPAILGAWLGGFASSDLLAVIFFAAAAGAALEVVVEVGRYVGDRVSGGLRSGWVLGGFLTGIGAMYLTGLLAA